MTNQTISIQKIAQRMSQIVLILALLLLIGHFLIYLHYAIGLMRFPFDYDQGEGFELVDTILFSQGEWPYRNNEVYPFYASNYPPLFHVILVPFVWVFGEAYWYGRLVGFLGTLITAGAIGYIVQHEEQHRLIALMSGLAFLASNVIYHVGPLFRQHMFMVMFETLAIAVLAHVNEVENTARRRRILALGIMLLLAAGYTKQLAIATCVGVFGFLFLRNPRRSIAWGVIFAAVAGAFFLWINLATGGEWWKNIIAANVNTYMPTQFVDLFKQWFRLHWALAILAALFVVYELYFTRLSLYSVWWVFAMANTILSGKWGAGDSYFATAIAATCLLAGRFAARTLRGGWGFPDWPIVRFFNPDPHPTSPMHGGGIKGRGILPLLTGLAIPFLFLAYGLSVIKMPTEGAIFGPLSDALGYESSYLGNRYAFYDTAGWVPGYATIGHVPTQQDKDNGWAIVDILKADDRPAMSEEAAFSLHADKDVVTNPTQLKNLYENALFDPTNLVATIRQHDFGVIIFRAQFYPPPVLDAVYEAYYPEQVIRMNGFDYEIWRPGPPQEEREAFALAQKTFTAETEVELLLTLPLEQTERWLTHAFTYHNWAIEKSTESGIWITGLGTCPVYGAQKQDVSLGIKLCPTKTGSELTINGAKVP
ncbi:MAG: hypothetical protein JXA10_00915 [Anaerolineae bacterium]|nr:hypothetical protein [Anaerolineae bacterium]